MGYDARAEYTRLLRSDSGPEWARLRALLSERGLDPNAVALATFFPDDVDMSFGILVTPGDHVYEFDLTYDTGDLAAAVISDWRDRSESWRESPHRIAIEAAFRLLAQDGA